MVQLVEGERGLKFWNCEEINYLLIVITTHAIIHKLIKLKSGEKNETVVSYVACSLTSSIGE